MSNQDANETFHKSFSFISYRFKQVLARQAPKEEKNICPTSHETRQPFEYPGYPKY